MRPSYDTSQFYIREWGFQDVFGRLIVFTGCGTSVLQASFLPATINRRFLHLHFKLWLCTHKKDYMCLLSLQALPTRRQLWGLTLLLKKIKGDCKLFSEMKWHTVDTDGKWHDQKVAYYVCNGGYYAWQKLVAPCKNQYTGIKSIMWSANMESIRKDVQCPLGVLKKRFLFLKNPIKHHFAEMSEEAFTTCCVIQNWLHKQDWWDD